MLTYILKSFLMMVVFTLPIPEAMAQSKPSIGNETQEQKTKRLQWWTDARFGMFIHFGLYAMPARHEWIRSRERITTEEYQKYFDLFNPDLFDPKKWAKEAKSAGMKYAVLTTKHHEGFCLFDSKYTAYKATNTPARRDLVKEFVEAFRAEGLRVGFYYSVTDWHHPDFPIDRFHPQRPVGQKLDSAFVRLNKGRDFNTYLKYQFNQITELLTNYGKIDLMWFDYPGKAAGSPAWAVELLKHVRKLQPGIIVNNRLGLGAYWDGQDFGTPEQPSAKELEKYKGQIWETCQTFSGSWGYYRDSDEQGWKTNRQLLDLLISSVSYGGNLILNVGPTARGEFDYRASIALDSISVWMHANSKSIYRCTSAPEIYPTPSGTKLTFNPGEKRLYIHVYEYPSAGTLVMHDMKDKVRYAQFLHDNSELSFIEQGERIIMTLPEKKTPYQIPVVELILY